jgi:MFS family permease
LTSCSFQFMFGKLYSVSSVKAVFLTSVLIFEIGSLISGTATISAALVLGRAISGLGSAGIIAGCFTCVFPSHSCHCLSLTSYHRMMTQSVPLRQRPMVGGMAAGIEAMSATAGPLLGGVLTDRLSWRWCFYINLPLGFITIILITLFFENPRKSTDAPLSWKQKAVRLDLLGTVVFVPSITSLLLALQWGGSKYGWGDVRIIVLLCISIVLLAAFIFQQWRKGNDATLPPRIFGNRSLISGCWFSFCNASALAIVDYYVPPPYPRPSTIPSPTKI